MTLREQFEKEMNEQGKIFPYATELYIKWLENKLETSHNSDYTATPKLPSVDDIFKYLGKTNDTDKMIIKVYLDAIKSLGNFG